MQIKPSSISVLRFNHSRRQVPQLLSFTHLKPTCPGLLPIIHRQMWSLKDWQHERVNKKENDAVRWGGRGKACVGFLSSLTNVSFPLPWLIAPLTSAACCHGNAAAAPESWVGESRGFYLVNTLTGPHRAEDLMWQATTLLPLDGRRKITQNTQNWTIFLSTAARSIACQGFTAPQPSFSDIPVHILTQTKTHSDSEDLQIQIPAHSSPTKHFKSEPEPDEG